MAAETVGSAGMGTQSARSVRIGGFAGRALAEESIRLGVSGEELARFSVLYYLADLDSGRIARRPPPALRVPAIPGAWPSSEPADRWPSSEPADRWPPSEQAAAAVRRRARCR